jgi:hypothetical protein
MCEPLQPGFWDQRGFRPQFLVAAVVLFESVQAKSV